MAVSFECGNLLVKGFDVRHVVERVFADPGVSKCRIVSYGVCDIEQCETWCGALHVEQAAEEVLLKLFIFLAELIDKPRTQHIGSEESAAGAEHV